MRADGPGVMRMCNGRAQGENATERQPPSFGMLGWGLNDIRPS